MSYSPSMVDGKIARLSVSQLSRFNHDERGGCQRKWWYKYVGKVPEPPKPSQLAGVETHNKLKAYFEGQAVVLSAYEQPILTHLPKPSEHVRPELELAFLTLLRIPFQGSIDLLHYQPQHVIVYDYKTQSKIKKYEGQTAQLWGYLEEARLRYPDVQRFTFTHVYATRAPQDETKGYVKPATLAVPQTFKAREIERRWLGYGPLVEQMQDVAAEPDVDKVPCNEQSCYAYGPCPYLSICNKNKGKMDMSFLESLFETKKSPESPVVTIPEVKAAILPPDAPPQQVPPSPPPPVDEGHPLRRASDFLGPQPGASTTPDQPKRRGRPPGAKNKPKDVVTITMPTAQASEVIQAFTQPHTPTKEAPVTTKVQDEQYPTPVKTEDVPTVRVSTLTLDTKIGLPGYSSIGVSLTATVMGDLDKAQEQLNERLNKALQKQAVAFLEKCSKEAIIKWMQEKK